ncbi:hypothetical protein [Microbacterium sp. XT11]|uniref:hypothetical protein n=1 Tax=Microbacterium sp. XT11 TaxID=367477 RepID=UPI000835A6F5|nr:hypothetical protein [Microbacterium sp. XT11]
MTVRLNKKAAEQARWLVRDGDVVRDERDDWSEHAPSTEDENAFIDDEGMAAYASWHLGEDTDAGEDTKGRWKFPYGDFRRVHRCAVISGESRAGQYDHDDIEQALKDILRLIDDEGSGRD